MGPELLFFNAFDSFELGPEYLEIIYQTKAFRFSYPLKKRQRKFSVQSFPKIQITISDMMLQTVDTNEVWRGALLVDLSAEFEDVAVLGDLVSKLKTIVGYKQLRLNPKTTTEDDEFSEDEIDETDEMELNILIGMGPKIMFHGVATPFVVNSNYFEFDWDGETYRFIHGAVNPPGRRRRQQLTRRFTSRRGLGRLPARSSTHLLIPGVMLQREDPLNNWYDVDEMDVYIEFAGVGWEGSVGNLGVALRAQGYVDDS